jgi:hypothetical protein
MENKTVDISLCSLLTKYDTRLALYSRIANTDTLITMNDDANPECEHGEDTNVHSRLLEQSLTSGIMYVIVVGGYSCTDFGEFEITINESLGV